LRDGSGEGSSSSMEIKERRLAKNSDTNCGRGETGREGGEGGGGGGKGEGVLKKGRPPVVSGNLSTNSRGRFFLGDKV
jgi:hypothetical protein